MKHGILVFFLASIAACSSVEADFCEKADECNALNGKSVDECTEEGEKSLDELPDGQRSDCEDELEDCLDKESCSAFGRCIEEDLDSCDSAGTGIGTGGGGLAAFCEKLAECGGDAPECNQATVSTACASELGTCANAGSCEDFVKCISDITPGVCGTN